MSLTDPPAAAAPDARASARPGRAETALLRAVLHILFGAWGLGAREVAPILGGVPLRTLFHWRERPEAAHIDPILRYRLAALLALHKALRNVHPDSPGQRAWLRTPGVDGRTPLALLTEGQDGDVRALRDRVADSPDSDRAGE